MSTTPTDSIRSYAERILETEPDQLGALLEVTLQATEQAKLEAERVTREAREMAEVELGPDGFHAKNLGGIWRLGDLYAMSGLVPEDFQGKPADCAIVVQLAQRWRVDPFMAFQNVYMVHGKPGVAGQMALALLNASGLIDGIVKYQIDGTGDDYGCAAVVTDKQTGEKVTGPKVTTKMVRAEGWDKPKGAKKIPSKWTTMPDLMFRYRAVMFLVRTEYPDVLMGLQSREELEDVGPTNGVTGTQEQPPAASPATPSHAEQARAMGAAKAQVTTEEPAEPEAEVAEPTTESDPKPDDGPAGFDRTKRMAAFRTKITKAKGVATVLADVICDLDADGELDAKDVETIKAEIESASQPNKQE